MNLQLVGRLMGHIKDIIIDVLDEEERLELFEWLNVRPKFTENEVVAIVTRDEDARAIILRGDTHAAKYGERVAILAGLTFKGCVVSWQGGSRSNETVLNVWKDHAQAELLDRYYMHVGPAVDM